MTPTHKLHHWFLHHQRSFPWREKRSPYNVWISEIMLQQTRASVVIPYFERWLERFPNIETLAAAPLEEVIKAWEGLGYYSRARALHATAQEIVSRHHGQIPSNREELAKLPGMGPYTIGAVLSFGFHQRASAIDGNAARVLARHFWIDERIDRASAKRRLRDLSDSLLDAKEPWVTVEALIELGASLCRQEPSCKECPLQDSCLARQKNGVSLLPIQRPEAPKVALRRIVTLIESENSFLVRKESSGRVMADLYQFPYFDLGQESPSIFEAQRRILSTWSLSTTWIGTLPPISHSFTRYQAKLFPYHLKTTTPILFPEFFWIPRADLSSLPFSSGHRKIMHHVQKQNLITVQTP